MTTNYLNKAEFRQILRKEYRVLKASHIVEPGLKTGFKSRFKIRDATRMETNATRHISASRISKQRSKDRDMKYGY
jgi:hypothetical protein